MPAEPPRFLADRMVGTLAKWLRILGYDTVYMPQVSPASVKREARRQGRILLTRRTCFLNQKDVPPFVFIRADRFREQLKQVCSDLQLSGSRPPCSGGAACVTGNWKQSTAGGFKPAYPPMCGKRKRPFSTAGSAGASIGTPPTANAS